MCNDENCVSGCELHMYAYLPCIKSGVFMRYQLNPGHRANIGRPLWPRNGAWRCLAKATALRTNTSSRSCGLSLASLSWYSKIWPQNLNLLRRPRDPGRKNLRYPSKLHVFALPIPALKQCLHTQQLVYPMCPCMPNSSARPGLSIEAAKTLTLTPSMPVS